MSVKQMKRTESSQEKLPRMKKRSLKRVEKELEDSSENESSGSQLIPSLMVKNADSQTPVKKDSINVDFMTPVKTLKHSDTEENRDRVRVNKALFSQESEIQRDSSNKSERKQNDSSENSIPKRVRSGINTSEIR